MQIETIDLVTPMPRAIYRFEALERRVLLTIVPIDATAGVPFEGLVATDLHLPAYATGPELMNVLINGQWDYEPTAVVKADGSIDLYAKMTPQRSGTEEMQIIFRNDISGGWDMLETGTQTVKENHFSAVVPDTYLYSVVPGTKLREWLVTFTETSLTQDLGDYVVDVNWFGERKSGRLERLGNGEVAAYVNDGYLPTNGAAETVTVTIRLAGDSVPKGHAAVYVGAYNSIGFGMFYGEMTSESDFRIDLPTMNPGDRHMMSSFRPATEIEGWESEFTVDVLWQDTHGDVATSTASIVRNADGSHAIVGTRPANLSLEDGMIKVHETVHRPAVDGQEAVTYVVDYIGSFSVAKQVDEEPPTSHTPVGTGGGDDLVPDDGDVDTFTPDDDVTSEAIGEVTTAARVKWSVRSTPHDSIADGMFSSADDPLLGEDDDADAVALVE